ncbi:MAG: N-acetylglucosamine-6-phosphate deacetylase [Clostridia bacterium]|nr:N-acetylglucosamine-6-phosphate deacetylase [Clostridia bacterium]
MKAIVNGNIVLENGIIWDGVLLIDGNKIVSFGKSADVQIPENADIIDAEGTYVGPGFVDIHVHGGQTYQTYENPVEACRFFLQNGTTSILATPSYGRNFQEFLEAFRVIDDAMGKVKNLKGIYCEGPYTNPNYGACADRNPWRHPICEKEYKALVDAAGKNVKVWAIAPEREGLFPFLEYARKVNPDVIFALGHSEATPMQICALGKYKPKIQTHSMCATGRLPVFGGTRGYGPDEYCFREPDMFAEVISDSCGIHVHPTMLQLLIHTKGVHRVILITDSTVSQEASPQEYAHIDDLNFDHNGGLSGSKLTMNLACRNIMAHTNCGIAQAFIMASTNPAKALGMGDEIGSIEAGKIADLVFVNDRFDVKQVMLGGEICKF